MITSVKLFRLGVTSASVVAGLVAYIVLGSTIEASTPASRQAPPRITGPSIAVCVGKDSILQAVPAGSPCPKEQVPLPLTFRSTTTGPPKILEPIKDRPAGPPPTPDSRAQNEQLAQLESRLRGLRRSALFVVVDAQGHRLMSVVPEGVLLYNRNEVAVAAITIAPDGGSFKTMSADGKLTVAAGVSEWRAGLWQREGDQSKIEMGRQPTGKYALKITSTAPADPPIAGIGESLAGTGALIVSNALGHARAVMSLLYGRGTLMVEGESGLPVGTLRESESGAGLLDLSDAGGNVVVKMDVNDNRYGAILTGPRAGFPFIPGSGLPGSYFLGCAGGRRCTGY